MLALALSLAVREALAIYDQEGAFKELTEVSDRRDPSRGNKSHRRFKPERFDPSNAADVTDTYTADASAAVVATG